MAGGKTVGTKLTRRGQQIGEFHRLVAADAGDRCFPAKIAVGKVLHHLVGETAFIIQNVMGDAETAGDGPRIMDVGAGAAGAFRLNGDPVVIELERDPHHIIALLVKQRGGDRRIDPAGHGDDDPCLGWRLG